MASPELGSTLVPWGERVEISVDGTGDPIVTGEQWQRATLVYSP